MARAAFLMKEQGRQAWEVKPGEWAGGRGDPRHSVTLLPRPFLVTKICTRVPRWPSGKESTCQCRRHQFNAWVRKIPCSRSDLVLCDNLEGWEGVAGEREAPGGLAPISFHPSWPLSTFMDHNHLVYKV